MQQGKSAEASQVFQDLVSNPQARFIAPYALISLGDIARLAGELDKAEASYNRVKTDFTDSSFAETARRRSATLRAKPPVEIAAPPAPKADNATALPALQAAPPIKATPAPANDPAPKSPADSQP